ncbi:MAG: electron transport complex subunit RsxC [Porticoccaceae bacterium]
MKTVGRMPGGVQPPEHKRESLSAPIAAVTLPSHLLIPLDQYGGETARPLVSAGAMVAKGQPIAAATGHLGSAVHAPTSGTVTAVTPDCITLLPDGQDAWCEHAGIADYRQQAPEALLDSIRDAGIVGLGGAGFPTAAKLRAAQSTAQPIATLIINAVECEPYITADTALIRERAAEIFLGIDILAHILGDPPTVAIGIEDNNVEARHALAAVGTSHAIAVIELPARYPSGGERQLIQLVTGREIPRGALPADVGVLCINVVTAHAVYRAVCRGEPLIARIVTVTGEACAKPGNYEVLIGTPIDHLLALSGFDPSRCRQPLLGGAMMGIAIADTAAPIAKTSNCILAPTPAEMPPPAPPQACIRCGYCADVCPAKLLPQQLYWYARSQDHQQLSAHNLFDCIECGACTYVCPSAIPLVPIYRAAKAAMAARREQEPAANQARQRFLHRQQRIAAIQDKKATQRAARRGTLAEAQIRVAEVVTAVPIAAAALAVDTAADTLIQTAMAQAAARPQPAQQRARLERAFLAATDRLDHAERALAGSDHSSPLGASQREQLEARVAAARLHLDNARGRLAAFEQAKRDR